MAEESEPDFGCYDCDDLDFAKLDPGIEKVVRWLIDEGFEPSDSGDGQHKLGHGWTEEDIAPYPHVYIPVDPESLVSECERLKLLLWTDLGLRTVEPWSEEGKPHIEANYAPSPRFDGNKGMAVIGLFNVTSDMVKREPLTKNR